MLHLDRSAGGPSYIQPGRPGSSPAHRSRSQLPNQSEVLGGNLVLRRDRLLPRQTRARQHRGWVGEQPAAPPVGKRRRAHGSVRVIARRPPLSGYRQPTSSTNCATLRGRRSNNVAQQPSPEHPPAPATPFFWPANSSFLPRTTALTAAARSRSTEAAPREERRRVRLRTTNTTRSNTEGYR
ncbi:MAG: hypothetical protein QOF66_3393 [Mycobacterium sp.]|jgi:hypothetical protein|nr:hypothetical protein [Mycobacterium sp.]